MHSMVEQKPGGGRHRPPHTSKGRQVEPQALNEVRDLLGERERTSREPHSRTVAVISRRHTLQRLRKR